MQEESGDENIKYSSGNVENDEHEDINISAEGEVQDKDENEEQKEDCFPNCIEEVDEKTDQTQKKEDTSNPKNHEDPGSGKANSVESQEHADRRNNIQAFQDSEDELETTAISNIDEPKQKILWAAEKNEVDVVRQLLEEESSLVNARDEDLYTPLHRACSNNHIEIIKLLLASGADLSAQTEDGWCPLHCACHWDNVEAASLLLQNGANINAISKGGLSPLHLAAANSAGRRTLELLLWHPHIDGTLKAENGDTAYDVACRTSNTLLRLFELLDGAVNCY